MGKRHIEPASIVRICQQTLKDCKTVPLSLILNDWYLVT